MTMIVLTKLAEFVFDNAIGKALAAVSVVLAVFAGWLWQHDRKVASVAKVEVVQQINKQTEKLSDEAVEARRPAARPGAADRLRKGSCYDC